MGHYRPAKDSNLKLHKTRNYMLMQSIVIILSYDNNYNFNSHRNGNRISNDKSRFNDNNDCFQS